MAPTINLQPLVCMPDALRSVVQLFNCSSAPVLQKDIGTIDKARTGTWCKGSHLQSAMSMLAVTVLCAVLLCSVNGFTFKGVVGVAERSCRSSLSMESVKPVKLLQAGMRYRSIPNSELVVSELCLGTMNFGDQLTKKTSHALLDAATQEYAINFIDTAESYPIPSAPSSHGKSERIIGEWLKGKGSSTRQQLVISTKVCGFSDEMNWVRNSAGGSGGSKGGTRLNKKQIVEAVDAQLTRLGTDYIDLLHFHWPDRYVPLNGAHYSHDLEREAVSLVEQLEAVGELVKAGKVRSFGLSNETPYGVASFVKTAELVGGLPRPVSLQNAYNLLEQNEFRMGLSEACAPLNGNLAVLAHSPLAGGALTGKYLDLDNTPQDARMRKYVGYMYRYVAAPAQAAVKDFSKVAASYDLPLGAVALAWVASQKVTSTVIGASSLGQLQEQVQALNLAPLGAELAQALAECSLQHLDPTKGRFDIIDPNLEYVDPSTLPWGAKDQDVDPELDILINQRLQ